MPSKPEPSGVIGRTIENGQPVIWKFDSALPPTDQRRQLPWLITLTWEYEGSDRNGMPPPELNAQMIKLEAALEGLLAPRCCRHAYSSTGNNKKELAYYASGHEAFMEAMNRVLEGHDRYPLDIVFHEDPTWSTLEDLTGDFKS